MSDPVILNRCLICHAEFAPGEGLRHLETHGIPRKLAVRAHSRKVWSIGDCDVVEQSPARIAEVTRQ